MNQLNSVVRDSEANFFVDRLPDILSDLSYAEENNCLKVIYKSTIYFLHFNQGELVYATNSVAPFERLERHLRRLSNQNPKINSIIKKPRKQFKNDLKTYISFPTDYQSIIWLLEVGHLTTEEAITLVRRINREVFESFVCLPDLQKYKVIPRASQIKELCRFNLNAHIEQCQKRLKSWDVFSDRISSSYQRPYLVTAKERVIANLSPEQNKTIRKLLKGLNFRQIGAVIDCDELIVAKILYPSILDNTIVLRDSKPPFDMLPNFPQHKNIFEVFDDADEDENSDFLVNSLSKQAVTASENTWKIAYVDRDSSSQAALSKYLEQNLFCTLEINNSMNAFAELIEFKPDLIFLQVNMPDLNGYELCSLLRNHQDLSSVPIIMVSEASSSIDETKSKRAGATDNITKPFDRTKLLTAIWQYLQ